MHVYQVGKGQPWYKCNYNLEIWGSATETENYDVDAPKDQNYLRIKITDQKMNGKMLRVDIMPQPCAAATNE